MSKGRATSSLLLLAVLSSGLLTAEISRDQADAAIIITVPGCAVDPGDVIAWWKGEESLVAEIGPDLTGTVAFANSIIGRGMQFDGTNLVGADTFPIVDTAVSLSMWIKPVDTGQVQELMSRWDFPSTDDSARSFDLLLSGQNVVWSTDETSTRRPEELVAAAPQLFDGEFHHLAATWNSRTMAVYIDGLPVASKPSQGGVLNPATTTPFRLGSKVGAGNPFHFAGVIDEPAVIKRALTAAEVYALYGAGPKGLCTFATTTGVVGPNLQIAADVGGVDPVLTPNGRYLMFRTRSTNVFPVVNDLLSQTPGIDLDQFDNYRDDLVLLDTKGTLNVTDDTLELLSVNSDELGGALDSYQGAMTPTASHVAFASISTDLVAGDTLAGRDVFLRNRLNGTTERVSVRSDGSEPQYTATGLNNDSRSPSVNDTGTVVAFESTNRNLAPEVNPVPGDTWQTYDIYVRDIADPNPTNHTTERITVGLGDTKANGSSSTPILSPDGRYVWFSSSASNLVAGDTNGQSDLFVHDRQTDVTSRLDITAATGLPLDGGVFLADVSPNRRWVTFSSNATTIVPGDTNGQYDAFRLDTQNSTVTRVSPSGPNQATAGSFAGSVSTDGRFVFFESTFGNIVADDTNGRSDVFVTDTTTGAIRRVSLDVSGDQRNGSSSAAVASGDGETVAYMFQAVGSGTFEIWRTKLELTVP